MRKGVLFAFAALLWTSAADAQYKVPNTFSVQGVLRDNAGKLQSIMVNVTVNLYDAQTGGNLVAGGVGYQGSVMATNGLFNISISDPQILSKIASTSTGDIWLELIVGNDTYPRQKVTPGMLALHAAYADSAGSADGLSSSCVGCVTGSQVANQAITATQIADRSITATKIVSGALAHSHPFSMRIQATAVTLNSGITSGIATCNAGEVVTGGSCDTGGTGATVYTNSPYSTTAWRCYFNPGSGTVYVNAMCLTVSGVSIP
jgi:hypothetical protein